MNYVKSSKSLRGLNVMLMDLSPSPVIAGRNALNDLNLYKSVDSEKAQNAHRPPRFTLTAFSWIKKTQPTNPLLSFFYQFLVTKRYKAEMSSWWGYNLFTCPIFELLGFTNNCIQWGFFSFLGFSWYPYSKFYHSDTFSWPLANVLKIRGPCCWNWRTVSRLAPPVQPNWCSGTVAATVASGMG